MSIPIVVPSYKRAGKAETLVYLPNAIMCIHAEELLDYSQVYPKTRLLILPPGMVGNIARVRNYILDHVPAPLCMMDDDISRIGAFEQLATRWLATENDVQAWLERGTDICAGFGAMMWGVNVGEDRQNYREYTPFSLTSYLSATLSVHLGSPLRFDERLPLKEDYDYFLQHVAKYRRVVRLNKYFYMAKHGSRNNRQPGGCAAYRTLDAEAQQFLLLQKKWGRDIVQQDSLKTSRSHNTDRLRTVDFNPILHVPVRGI